MALMDQIAQLPEGIGACMGDEIREMREDIYYYFSQQEFFEVLRIDQTKDPERQVVAACISTLPDPIFEMVVLHTWRNSLAYDDEWHEFETRDEAVIFRFLTWDEHYISGEIWFDRSKETPGE